MKHITPPSDRLPVADKSYLSASAIMKMPETSLLSKQSKKSIAQLFTEPHAWIADSRFTKWDEVPAAEHALPQAPPPATSLYEKFGEECASRGIIPTYRLFEHWLDSDAIARDSGQHPSRRRN